MSGLLKQIQYAVTSVAGVEYCEIEILTADEAIASSDLIEKIQMYASSIRSLGACKPDQDFEVVLKSGWDSPYPDGVSVNSIVVLRWHKN